MKYQFLFSQKDKSKKIKCRLQQFLFGALRAKNLQSVMPHNVYQIQITNTESLKKCISQVLRETRLWCRRWGFSI